MNRRQFVVGSTLVGASFVQRFGFEDSVKLRWVGKKLLVTHGEVAWEIDPEFFGRFARVRYRRHSQGYVIALSNAFLPGTDLETSFWARLTKGSEGWLIDLSIPSIGFSGRELFEDWIRGSSQITAEIMRRSFHLGGNPVEIIGPQIRLAISSPFNLSLGGDGSSVRMLGPTPSVGEAISFSVARTTDEESISGRTDAAAKYPITRFSLEKANFAPHILLGDSRPGTSLTFEPNDCADCVGESYDRHGSRYSTILITANGALNMHGIGSNPVHRCRLQLDRAGVLLRSGPVGNHLSFAATIGRSQHAVDFGSWVATISGDETSPMYAEFQGGKAEIIDVSGRLHKLSLALEDAEAAHVQLTNHPLKIAISTGSETFSAGRARVIEAKEANERGSSIILVGKEPSALISLNWRCNDWRFRRATVTVIGHGVAWPASTSCATTDLFLPNSMR
jgi:hypothetical protein